MGCTDEPFVDMHPELEVALRGRIPLSTRRPALATGRAAIDPDVQRLVEAWPALTEEQRGQVRAIILACAERPCLCGSIHAPGEVTGHA